MKKVLIRYGELTLKGRNRSEFERILFNNIRRQLSDFKIIFNKDRNRIYLEIENENDFDDIAVILKKVPGIHNFSIAEVCDVDIEAIKDTALRVFDRSNPVFKVETKRGFKRFPMLSNDVSRAVGGHILINNDGLAGMRVDVRNPDQLLVVEIQEKRAYVFHKTIKGMGGLPIGSSGRGLVLLSGGIDSPVAAVLAMKRGLKINCIHFSSPPYTNDQALQKVVDLLSVLHEYDRDIKLFNVNFTDLQLAIHQNCVDKYEVTILRRMMLKQAEMVARRIKAPVLVTGESLGQVASQTIEGMNVSDVATKMLILRPLITMDKLEIIEIARNIGTYDISVLPFEDCCVIFLPKNPATSPKLDFVENEEKKIDFVKYLNENDIEIITYDIIRNRNTIIDSLI